MAELWEETPLLVYNAVVHVLCVVLIPLSTGGTRLQQIVVLIYCLMIYLGELTE